MTEVARGTRPSAKQHYQAKRPSSSCSFQASASSANAEIVEEISCSAKYIKEEDLDESDDEDWLREVFRGKSDKEVELNQRIK